MFYSSFDNYFNTVKNIKNMKNSAEFTNILDGLQNIVKINPNLSFKNRQDMTFTEYVSCSNKFYFLYIAFYSTYLTNILGLMNNDIANSIYSVVVCYAICMIFNTLSAIFGLIASMINDSFMKKKKTE